jgi:hypothetical protein
MTRPISARLAATTAARNGSPIAGLPAIWDIIARITGPNGLSVIARMGFSTAARSSARVSPTSRIPRCGRASSSNSSRVRSSFEDQRR